MLSKTLFLAFAAIATVARAATPPGCLLGAVNQYEDPANIKAVCSDKEAVSKIAKTCGDATKDALSAFADLCNTAAGVKVDTTLPTSTGSSSPSGTGSASNTGLSVATSAASTTGGAAASTASRAPQSTGAAGKLEVGAAALLAGLGVMAAAL